MAEPDKRQIGDGSDNYGEAAKQMAKAAKEAGKETAKQAAVKGAEAGANAAAATVQAGVEGGKAVAEIAAGTAAGGPWGAILSAAWAMRHTLFKILVCICLLFLVIIVLIVSLPSVVTNSVFGLDGSMVDMENPTTLLESYTDRAADISAVVEEGYDAALAKVEQIIEDGGYDYDLSMDALINYAQGSAGYDVSYILAAYSASLQQRNTGKEDMLAKLRSVADSMFPVSFVEKESEQIVPFTYATYRPVTVTVVTSKTQTGTINGIPQYRYTTARRTYYEPDETITTSEPVNVAAYTPVAVSVPIYSGGRITGTRSEIYYEQGGTETLTPETEVVKYVECTVQPFDNSVIIRAFGIDPSATYDQFKITYGEAIQKMANALKMTLYGTLGNGQMVPLTDAELIAFVNAQNCSPMRKHIITTALSLVGKVPYFWGGKSAPGWNDAWNTPRLVTSAGSPTTGTIRPFGLDCSGFTTWVFNTAVQRNFRLAASYGCFYLLLALLLYGIRFHGLRMPVFSEFYVLMFWNLSPIFLVSWDLITTPPGMLSAFLSRLRMPTPFILGLLVVFRFFPTMRTELKGVGRSMKNRGLTAAGRLLAHPVQSMEYVLVPFLLRVLQLADQLSVSAVARGAERPGVRGSYYEKRIGARDHIAAAACAIVTASYLVLERSMA